MVKFRYILMLVLFTAIPVFFTIFLVRDLIQFHGVKKEELKKVEAQVIDYKESDGRNMEYEFTLLGHTGIFYTRVIRKFKYDDFEDNYNTENVYTFWVESNYDKQQWVDIYEMKDNKQTYLEISDVIKSQKLNIYNGVILWIVLLIGALIVDIALFRIRRELI